MTRCRVTDGQPWIARARGRLLPTEGAWVGVRKAPTIHGVRPENAARPRFARGSRPTLTRRVEQASERRVARQWCPIRVSLDRGIRSRAECSLHTLSLVRTSHGQSAILSGEGQSRGSAPCGPASRCSSCSPRRRRGRGAREARAARAAGAAPSSRARSTLRAGITLAGTRATSARPERLPRVARSRRSRRPRAARVASA